MAAYNRCWYFGDEFGRRSFEQYFQMRESAEYNSYVKANFDTIGFFGSFVNDNPSLIGRLGNLMCTVINNKTDSRRFLPLPKLIIVVPDEDIIKCFKNQIETCQTRTAGS